MEAATAEQVHDTLAKPIKLTLFDNCDRCGVQAYVRLVKDTYVLDLCGHDYGTHSLALLAAGWEVVDDTRATLVPQPAG